MRKGKFITFEGPEGAGKTTQAKRLMARLQERGFEIVYTREPGGTKVGESIRGILQYNQAGEAPCAEAEVLLFAASRAHLVRKVILPALERGAWVVCDRFADSTTAYQGFGRGFSVDQMLIINAFAIDGAIPDLTLLLDVEVEVGFDRLLRRQEGKPQKYDRIESEARSFHIKVREGYLQLARRFPERFRVMNAARPEAEVEQEIWQLVTHAFELSP